jgi:NTE family protein
MKRLMVEMNTPQLLDPPGLIRFPLYKWLRMYFSLGLFNGDDLEKWLLHVLKEKGVIHFSDLSDEALRVIVADVSKKKIVVFPDDLAEYGIDPGQFSVARAVRMSAGLPFFFKPVPLSYGSGQKSLMVDGGVLSNFPLWLFDRENNLPLRPFLGLQVTNKIPNNESVVKIRNAADLFRGMFTTMREARDEQTIEKLQGSNIITIPITEVKTKDLQISREERERLYQIGREEAKRFLKKWCY